MTSRIVIGFAGRIGSGKTTAAQHLVEKHNFQRLRFAGPLKAMAAAFGLTYDEIEGTLKEKPCDLLCGKTPREFMQKLGTEFGRQMIGHDVWTGAWRAACARVPDDVGIVVDDVRFANEAEAVRSLSPYSMIVRLSRDGLASASHVSELQVISADHRIANNGSVAELRAAVDALLLWQESTAPP